MTVYYSDDQIALHHGDALDVARELPSGSVDCIVTSPPYYGLRDYGTGKWIGGDPNCNHRHPTHQKVGTTSQMHAQSAITNDGALYRGTCGVCGAQRHDAQYGLEETPQAYVETMRALFGELRRVLAVDGTLWLNIGDSYTVNGVLTYNNTPNANRDGTADTAARAIKAGIERAPIRRTDGLPAKNLLGIPWRTAFALQDDGWILRNAIIWNKPNAMPESVTDRLSGRYEHVFLFSKSRRYWFDLDPIREPHATITPFKRTDVNEWVQSTPWNHNRTGTQGGHANGRNPGDVWTLPTQPFPGAHFAVYPIQLPQRCIQAGCKPGGTVLDPFNGSGTTGLAAQRTGRRYVGVDINAEYLDLTLNTRLQQPALDFEEPA